MGLIQVSIPVGISAAAGWAMGGGCLGDETGGGRRGGLGGRGLGKSEQAESVGLLLLVTLTFLLPSYLPSYLPSTVTATLS